MYVGVGSGDGWDEGLNVSTTNLCPGTYLESGTRWALALSRILGICSGLSGGAGRKVKILTKRSAALLILEARSEQSKE